MFEQFKLFFLPEPTPQPKARQLLIAGRIVDYHLKTGVRRLSMSIDERGLRLAAPSRMPLAEIEAFANSHGVWVLRKLDELARTNQPRHVSIKDGVRLPFLGDEIEVRIVPGANRVRWMEQCLMLEARDDADLGQLTIRGLKARALTHFDERLTHYTAQLNLPAPPLGLSAARTRWGSCSRTSGIRINWRLIHLPAHIGDYVVAHEAAHLLEMNHSDRFWRVVGTLYPDWQAARNELKTCATSIPIL
ncbi:MAG: SprT family zinc-dependent metalloprotease [Rugosibacter sp.]